MSNSLRLPPSPDAEFLGVPIPDLSTEAGRALVSNLRWQERERVLAERTDKTSADWLVESAVLARDLGQYDRALKLGAEGFQRAFRGRSMTRACEALAIRASALHAKGEFDAAYQVVSQLRLLTNAEEDVRLAAIHDEAEGALHLRTVVRDWFADARTAYETALPRFVQSGDTGGQIRILAGLASTKSGYGAYFPAIEHATEALRISAESSDWRYVGKILLEAALALRDQGYRLNVEDLFKLAIEWCEFTGDAYNYARSIEGLAYLYDFEAQLDSAADFEKSNRTFCEAIEAAHKIGSLPVELSARLSSLHLYQKFGQHELIVQQRENIDRQAQALTGSRAKPWLEIFDDYGQYVENLRRDRYLARLRDGIAGVADPFFIFDPILRDDGTCADFVNEFRNSAAARLLGIERYAVRTLQDLLLTPYFADLKPSLLRAVNDQEGYDDEICVTCDSGEKIWYVRRVVPAGDGTVVTFRDSTATRKVEEVLRDAAYRANLADRAKSEFLANMTHEVRTPIHGVLGLARLLGDSGLNAEQQAYIDGIISSGDILLRVIGDVLDVSKIEADRMEVIPTPTDARKLISEVVSLYRGQAIERGLTISGETAEDVPNAVLLDGPRVRQILGNLVGNAVKFTQSGFVKVSLNARNRSLEFNVEDSGPGLAPDQLERVFQPFTQAHGTVSEGGTGLGLTISSRLAELMGGKMTVTSQVGEGSRFSFSIPLKATQPVEVVEMDANSPRRFDGGKVLLVEDNPVNVLVAKGLLTKLGCETTVAGNGLQALDLLAREEFGAVLMDVRMPVLDGLATTREIRSREEGKSRIPIIALTAGTLLDERMECFEAGMDDYLAKPFTMENLRATLSRVMKKQSPLP